MERVKNTELIVIYILNISLINYKFFSERYIIFEKNGKGKEYNKYNDTLVFEGEYLNIIGMVN